MTRLMKPQTINRFMEGQEVQATPVLSDRLEADRLRQLCLDAGVDDVGFVEIDRTEIADQRADILAEFPYVKTLISFVCRMNREPLRTPARSVANVEVDYVVKRIDEVGHKIVAALERQGVRAVNITAGFPMEMARFPGKSWVVAHKPIAVAAGLGHMGHNRNLIHPRFGNFVVLGTVLMDADITETGSPLKDSPCLECKLCVAACPSGAIGPDGYFNFSACYTHTYREYLSGFTNWVENIADSKNARDYRSRVPDTESVSMWQSLSYGANFKCSYCIAVCPAGEYVENQYLTDKKGYLQDVVKPLQKKEEPVYVVPGSDAETHVIRRFPRKTARRVGNSLRPQSIQGFLSALPLIFQRNQAEDLDATYHFTFTGQEEAQATVVIRDKAIQVQPGHVGTADMQVTADSRVWLKFLAKEQNIATALLLRKICLKGSPRLLMNFGRCFPS